jgi:hypothetical protein
MFQHLEKERIDDYDSFSSILKLKWINDQHHYEWKIDGLDLSGTGRKISKF